jgi:thioredoxin reductase (NADPH)
MNDGGTSDLEVAGLFVYVGLQPATAYLKELVKLDAAGAIPTDGHLRTELKGVYAAGMVRAGASGRAAGSAGDGAAAAIAAERYLTDGLWRS